MKKFAIIGVFVLMLSSVAGAKGLAKLDAVQAEWDALYQTWVGEVRAVKSKEERKAMIAKRPRSKKHIERMVALVNEHAENEGILKHIGWLLTVTQGQLPEGVLEVLGKHKESAKFSQILPYLAMSAEGSEGKELFNWVRKSSPHKEVQAMAAYANSMSRGISEDEKMAELRFVRENGGALEFRGKKIAEAAGTKLFAAENLVVGKEAPNISGEDLEGVKFDLTDYRGKVVVLDFWGHW